MKYLLSYLLIIHCIVLAGEMPIKNQDVSPQQLQKQNKKIVQLVAQEILKQLPQKIDKYTTMTNIIAQDTTLIYVHEINTGVKSDEAIIKEDHSRMQRAITNGVCKTSQRFLEAKITLIYQYISAISKKELFKFTIKQSDCLKGNR